jgi:peptide/nickel transport system substrate-binding protein
VVFAIGGAEPTPLLPPLAADILARIVTDNVFDRLAEIGPDLNTIGDRGFQPRLAQKWTWAADSMSIAFSLDPRARWHDGQPVRASDIRFSFDVNKDPKTATQVTASIANVDSVTMRDSATAVVWYHRRTPEQFYDFVYQVPILPEHVLKGIARDQLGASEVVRRPIGTGRFRFGRWEPGVRIELLADTANYRGRPKLDRFIISFAADAGAAITQLLSGQSDFFDNVPAPVIPRVDSASHLRTVRYPGLAYAYMGMNLRDPKRLSAPHSVFGDRRVRLAISMALDRQAMLRNVFDTLGILGLGPYPRTLADTTVKAPPFDRARSAALLDSAGWRVGAGGVRSKSGRPLAFSLAVPTSSAPRQAYAVLIQEQLKSIGANVEIERVDISTFIERTSQSRNFDAAMLSTNTDPSPAGIKQNWGT